MHRVTIETHADDAYLSLHNTMKNWLKNGDQVTIVTVYSGTRKRAIDAQNYASSIGAAWVGLGYDEGDKYTNLEFRDKLNPLYDDDIAIYIPFGIQNKEHQQVRRAIYFNEETVYQYLNIPYYTKPKNQEEVNAVLEDMEYVVTQITPGGGRKGDEKYWKCFKDQSKFFYFNPPESYKNIPEIIVFKQ